MSERPGAPRPELKAHDALHGGAEDAGQYAVMEMIVLSLKYGINGKGLTKTAVQKVLYELKRSLPEGNRVGDSLPYYWFEAGPFSEHVARGLDDLQSGGAVVREDHGRYSVFKLGREGGRLVEHDADIQEARAHLQRIVRGMRPLSAAPEMRAQYERCAPAPFCPKFKLDFMPVLEAHGAEAGRVDSNQAALLTGALHDATMSFPAVPLFRDFKRPYSDFQKACRRVPKWAGKGDKKGYAQLVKKAADMSRQVRGVFACGARIMEPADSSPKHASRRTCQASRCITAPGRTLPGRPRACRRSP